MHKPITHLTSTAFQQYKIQCKNKVTVQNNSTQQQKKTVK